MKKYLSEIVGRCPNEECQSLLMLKHCEAILFVESEDINKFNQNINLYYTFKCLCCNIDNIIPVSLIPLFVRVLALKKFKLSLKGNVLYEGFNV